MTEPTQPPPSLSAGEPQRWPGDPVRMPGTFNVLLESSIPAPPAELSHDFSPRRRKLLLPITLFVLTCLSTLWAGITFWHPEMYLFGPYTPAMVWEKISHGGLNDPALQNGLMYMAAVIGILLAHEMGHFVMTLRYRIPASLPFFIPVPIMPFGTMGAVIGMDGRRADRKAMFDTGLAGPLAGLVVAIPVLWIGVANAEFVELQRDQPHYHNPLLVDLLIEHFHGDTDIPAGHVVKLNPFYFAGWVGLLVTGLNMMPISQLDGGHVTYALFGKKAHWIARAFLIGAIIFIIAAEAYIWTVMIVLVTLIGTDHPPTADDTAELGFWRKLIGCASLSIPVLCFPPMGITQ